MYHSMYGTVPVALPCRWLLLWLALQLSITYTCLIHLSTCARVYYSYPLVYVIIVIIHFLYFSSAGTPRLPAKPLLQDVVQ